MEPPRLQVEDEEGNVGWRRKKAAGAPLGAAVSFATGRSDGAVSADPSCSTSISTHRTNFANFTFTNIIM
jgi:hypothetical protein